MSIDWRGKRARLREAERKIVDQSRAIDELQDSLRILENPRTDAERLAVAVLKGDAEAAFALADEVQMSMSAGEDLVKRQELIDFCREAHYFIALLQGYVSGAAYRGEGRNALMRRADGIMERMARYGEEWDEQSG